MAVTLDPTKWGVTQETYDNNDIVEAKFLYNIADEGLQSVGVAVEDGVFQCQIDEPRESNPLNLTFWNFAMYMMAWSSHDDVTPTYETIASLFSDIYYATSTPKYLGYGRTSTSGSTTIIGISGQGSESANQFLENTFGNLQNNLRWYPSQELQYLNTTLYQGFHPYIKMNFKHICGVVKVQCCHGIEDLSYISGDAWDNLTIHEFDLDEWYSLYRSTYPCIIKAYIKWFMGSISSRSYEDVCVFSDRDLYCDDLCKTYTRNSIGLETTWTETEHSTINGGVIPRGYLTQTTLYEGFIFYQNPNNNPSVVTGVTRGLFKNSNVCRACYTYNGSLLRPFVVVSFAGTVDDLRKAADQFRTPIAISEDKAKNGNIKTDPGIRVPRSNDDGTLKDSTTDPDEKEKELDEGPQKEGFEVDEDKDYHEPDPEDPDDEDYMPVEDPEEDDIVKDVPLNEPQLGTVGVFNRCYACNSVELQELADYLWNVDEDVFETILKGLSLMGQNPMNAIISIIMYPFEVDSVGSLEDIRIGTVDTEITALPIDFSSVRVFDLGTCYLHAKYQNYLDYAPYTSASLYVPYVGVINLPLSEFMHKFITVKLVVDIMTGVGQIVVYAKPNNPNQRGDGVPVLYRNCVIGAQVAVTGQDASMIAGNYIKAISNLANGMVGVANGNVAGGASGVAEGAIGLLTAQNVPVESSGSNSPQCGFFMPQRCGLIVNRPRPVDVENYGRLVGYACYDSGNVGKFTGYAEFTNIKLDINVATDDEKKEIIAKLQSGVYV